VWRFWLGASIGSGQSGLGAGITKQYQALFSLGRDSSESNPIDCAA
jgi:hypothetical protein